MNVIIYTVDGGIAYLKTDYSNLDKYMDALNLFPKPFIKATNRNGSKVLINTRNISAIEEDN